MCTSLSPKRNDCRRICSQTINSNLVIGAKTKTGTHSGSKNETIYKISAQRARQFQPQTVYCLVQFDDAENLAKSDGFVDPTDPSFDMRNFHRFVFTIILKI